MYRKYDNIPWQVITRGSAIQVERVSPNFIYENNVKTEKTDGIKVQGSLPMLPDRVTICVPQADVKIRQFVVPEGGDFAISFFSSKDESKCTISGRCDNLRVLKKAEVAKMLAELIPDDDENDALNEKLDIFDTAPSRQQPQPTRPPAQQSK